MAIAILAKKRSSGDAENTRMSGMIPAVVYGPGVEPQSIAVEASSFEKIYKEAGEATLVDFSVDGSSPVKVLIQALQYHPTSEAIVHVDFRQINMNQEMTATVGLEFIGDSTAVKEGGTLNVGLDEVEVECLPKHLVSSITVDISVLKTFDDAIYVKDLKLPEGITVLDDKDTLVANVSAPLTEEELKAMDAEDAAPVSLDTIEVEKKGKKEDEAAAAAAADKK